MESSLRRSRAVLLGLAAAAFAVTAVAWFVAGTIAWFGITTGLAFAGVALATPWLSRHETAGPLCRSCHAPVQTLAYGFCLNCGVMRPVKEAPTR